MFDVDLDESVESVVVECVSTALSLRDCNFRGVDDVSFRFDTNVNVFSIQIIKLTMVDGNANQRNFPLTMDHRF